jgi:hypothetical protein
VLRSEPGGTGGCACLEGAEALRYLIAGELEGVGCGSLRGWGDWVAGWVLLPHRLKGFGGVKVDSIGGEGFSSPAEETITQQLVTTSHVGVVL